MVNSDALFFKQLWKWAAHAQKIWTIGSFFNGWGNGMSWCGSLNGTSGDLWWQLQMGLILIRISFQKRPNGFLLKWEEFVKNGSRPDQMSARRKKMENCPDEMHVYDFYHTSTRLLKWLTSKCWGLLVSLSELKILTVEQQALHMTLHSHTHTHNPTETHRLSL